MKLALAMVLVVVILGLFIAVQGTNPTGLTIASGNTNAIAQNFSVFTKAVCRVAAGQSYCEDKLFYNCNGEEKQVDGDNVNCNGKSFSVTANLGAVDLPQGWKDPRG